MQEQNIEEAIRRILKEELSGQSQSGSDNNDEAQPTGLGNGIFETVDEAIAAAKQAQEIYADKPMAFREKVIQAIKDGFGPKIHYIAQATRDETGMGTVEAKETKLKNALYNTAGPEILKPDVETGDGGMIMYEYTPFGVIGGVGPSTNPGETVINNSIMMLSGGNVLFFGAHPGAKNITRWMIEHLNEFVYKATGLRNLVVSLATPSIESVQQMMHHPDVDMLAVTGGPAVVHQALISGKKKQLVPALVIHLPWLTILPILIWQLMTSLLHVDLITTFCVPLKKKLLSKPMLRINSLKKNAK